VAERSRTTPDDQYHYEVNPSTPEADPWKRGSPSATEPEQSHYESHFDQQMDRYQDRQQPSPPRSETNNSSTAGAGALHALPPLQLNNNVGAHGGGSNAGSGSSASASMVRYREEYAALLARLKALKEARIRRAAATYMHGASILFDPTTYDVDEHSAGTKSSTQFGGSHFMGSLQVD
jgi:hypothetical protein